METFDKKKKSNSAFDPHLTEICEKVAGQQHILKRQRKYFVLVQKHPSGNKGQPYRWLELSTQGDFGRFHSHAEKYMA
jgi:hypothetical protein